MVDLSSDLAGSSELSDLAVKRSLGGIVMIGVASALINILYLTGSFYMLQVYDRVIPSRSIPSLIALSMLALMLYLFQGAFEVARSRMLVRLSGVFDEIMSSRVFRAMIKAPVKANDGESSSMLRDFDQVRTFLSSPGPSAFFDLPWLPFYIGICFMFHPLIGFIAIGGGIMLTLLAYLTNCGIQFSAKQVHEQGAKRIRMAEAAQRNAEVIEAMGMSIDLARLWLISHDNYRDLHRHNSDTANAYATASKIFRIAFQSGVLAAGAILVIEGQASGGVIIAASILTSRALAPIELSISHWRGFVQAQQSWKRLRLSMTTFAESETTLTLPSPQESLTVEQISSGPPGRKHIIIQAVSFELKAGSALGVVGPSGSGKSSLSRALTGIWPIYRGSVRLDGAALDQLDDLTRGRRMGYLPQDIELFAGTIADNIARFQEKPPAHAVIAAAKAAGVHDLILHLPNGYGTEIGPGGSVLSAGQRQRVGLARALYNDPFLVVLDEPNSNLDAEGEQALTDAIFGIRRRNGIAIVIAHRPSALAAVDQVLMMGGGKVLAFGPKEEVLPRILRREYHDGAEPRPMPLKIVSDQQV